MTKSTKPKTVSPETAIAAALDIARGEGRRPIMAKHEISARDVETLRRLSGQELADFKEGLMAELRSLQSEILADIKARKAQIPAGQLAVTYGILTDKLAGMEGGSLPAPTHQTNIQINGVPIAKSDLIAALSGGNVRIKATRAVELATS